MFSLLSLAKSIIPKASVSLPIIRGPLRGGRFYASPRVSMRKVMGLYESELNPWLANAMRRADLVLDVGANDGYFTFGCAAAMRRLGKPVRIVAFEPQAEHVFQLETARASAGLTDEEIRIVPELVGQHEGRGTVTLDSFAGILPNVTAPLLKIDVEGAEVEVINGARLWLSRSTMLLIEVHVASYLEEIPRRLAASVGPLDRVDQKALPLLGRERRDEANWWLLSRLS
jgi:hypothetical protein